MWFRFNIEQLVAKDTKILVSRGGRHFLIGGLSSDAIANIVHAFESTHLISLGNLSEQARKILLEHEIVIPVAHGSLPVDNALKVIRGKELAYRIAYPIRHLGSLAGLFVLLAISLLIYFFCEINFHFVVLAELVKGAPVLHIALAVLVFLFTLIFHELGHAASACYYTGTVGKVRFRFIWGVPAITVDVTSFCLATRSGKVAISVAGSVFQIFVSMCILASSDVYGFRVGATAGIFLAVFNLVPLPYYDGYWVLVDLFGRPFLPRILKAKYLLEIGYGASLLALFVASLPVTANAIFAQISFSKSLFETAPARGVALFCFGVFAAVSFTIFGISLFKSLFGMNDVQGAQQAK